MDYIAQMEKKMETIGILWINIGFYRGYTGAYGLGMLRFKKCLGCKDVV